MLRKRWLYVASLGALGYTAFNALFYVSAHYTGALNMSLIQACIPALVLIGAAFGFGARARPCRRRSARSRPWRRGDRSPRRATLARLATLAFNFGDALLLIACVLYAYYALALRYRPAVSSIGFLAGMALAALVTSIPPFLWEVWRNGFVGRAPRGFAVLVYAALGPAFLAQLFFMRGVQLIGPGRAGVFVNLVPIFGAFLAVGLLGEPLGGLSSRRASRWWSAASCWRSAADRRHKNVKRGRRRDALEAVRRYANGEGSHGRVDQSEGGGRLRTESVARGAAGRGRRAASSSSRRFSASTITSAR